ncbi:hypothetical protein INT47_004363, partial [Mucor saturninus]
AIRQELEFEPDILNGFIENEEYLNSIKIKEAKKRTAQEAELSGVDMTHSSIKQYRSEALIDASKTRQKTGLLDFSWCEKLVETQKYAQIVEVDYDTTITDRKYADGLGKSNNSEVMFIESSSGLLQENISHTLEDTLKLIVECNGALCYILSHFRNSRLKTALKKTTFDVQVIKDTITLSKMNLNEDRLWKFVELRSATISTNWSGRFNWVNMFELLAMLFLCLKEERVDMQMKKENSGLTVVPYEETLAAFLSFSEL